MLKKVLGEVVHGGAVEDSRAGFIDRIGGGSRAARRHAGAGAVEMDSRLRAAGDHVAGVIVPPLDPQTLMPSKINVPSSVLRVIVASSASPVVSPDTAIANCALAT